MTLSVIIVSYNVKLLLEQCIITVEKAIGYMDKQSEIIVVDNHSSDDSVANIRNKFPQIRIILNENNLGFSKACNQGVKASWGKHVLFLNPDTLVPPDCFKKGIDFFESHPDAGAVGVRMLNANGRYLKESKRGFPSPGASFYRLSGLSAIFPRSKKIASYYAGHLDEKENHKVEVLSGAFMMVRRDVLEKTGYFDESFFMYGEDIDLSYRIIQSGFSNYYLGEITIVHLKGMSTRKNKKQLDHFYGAMNIFLNKHYEGKKPPFSLFLIRSGIWTRKMFSKLGYFIRNFFSAEETK